MLKSLFKVEDEKSIRPVSLVDDSKLAKLGSEESAWQGYFDSCFQVPGAEKESHFQVYQAGDLDQVCKEKEEGKRKITAII
jgi:hypothetical protein